MNKDYIRNIEGKDFDFLIGKSIIKVISGVKVYNDYDESDGYILICNDGTEIRVALNEGCGGCGNGWSEIDLRVLENNKNVITNVEYKKGNDSDVLNMTMMLLLCLYITKIIKLIELTEVMAMVTAIMVEVSI